MSGNVENMKGSEKNKDRNLFLTDHQDTYKIYDYVKSHPGTFLALLSLVFTVLSFVCRYIFYSQEVNQAQIWNVAIQNIETQSFAIYPILEKMLRMLLLTLTTGWLYISFNAYFSRKKPFMIRDSVVKIAKRYLKKLRNKISSDVVDPKLKECVGEIEVLIKELENIKYDCWTGLKREICKILFVYSILNLIWRDIIVDFAFCLFFALLIYVLYYSRVRKEINKEYDFSSESEFLNSLRYLSGFLEKLKSGDLKFYLGEYIKIHGLKSLFSDAKIKSFVQMIAILILVGLAGYSVWQKVHSIFDLDDSNKTFQIVTENDKTYAVVYQTKDFYVLESATINNDEITIDTTKQRIIQTSDFIYEIKKFSSIKKLDVNDKNEEKEAEIYDVATISSAKNSVNEPLDDIYDQDTSKNNDNDSDTVADTINEPADDIDDQDTFKNNDDDSDTVVNTPNDTINDTIKNEQDSDLKNDQ